MPSATTTAPLRSTIERTEITGRIESTAYLGRILDGVPYGRSSRLRHVVGGSHGGGFEWTAGPSSDSLAGVTALELDAEGLITRITSVYDSAPARARSQGRPDRSGVRPR
jgi:hypothetical protein